MREKKEPVFAVDESSDLPIWAQLRNRMSYLIRTGGFLPGEQLPSVRSLAAEAQINYNTVTKAYRALEDDGLIVNKRGRGTFVADSVAPESDERTASVDSLVEDCVNRYRALGMDYDDIEQRIAGIVARTRA